MVGVVAALGALPPSLLALPPARQPRRPADQGKPAQTCGRWLPPRARDRFEAPAPFPALAGDHLPQSPSPPSAQRGGAAPARGPGPPSARPPRPGEEERPRPWPFPLQPLPPARGPVAAGHGGAPGASGPAGGGRAGAGKAGAAGPRGGCPGRAAAAAGREGGWDPPGRRDEVPGGACGRLRGAAAQPCSAPPLSLRRCRTSGLAGVCPAGALPEPPAPAGRRGLLYRRAAGGRLLLPPGRAGPPPGSAGLARSGRGGFAPARPGGLLTRLRGGALGSPERARGCPRVLVPLGPSGRRDCGEHRKRACGEQIRSAGIRAPVPGRPRRPWVAWRRTRAAQGPAGVWARRAVPAWGREGRACPPCPEPPRGGGPGRRRVVLASQPLWTRGACPREASELRSGFSPVRPCQARLRCARVKGLCGRGTRVVLPNLRVSVVIEFPKTGVCGVKYKPKKPLNVSLCEQRRAVPAMKRSPLWPARGKL